MIIQTTVATYVVTAFKPPDYDPGDVLVVESTLEGLAALRDGVILSDALPDGPWSIPGSADPVTGTASLTIDATVFAVWLQFEVLNFLTYAELPKEFHDPRTG